MNTDKIALTKFKKAAWSFLFSDDSPLASFMVYAKYGGKIGFYAANDSALMRDVLPQLKVMDSDYYVWAVFDDNAEARSYFDKVWAMDVSSYIPKDPKLTKAEWYDYLYLSHRLYIYILTYR